MNHDDEKPQTNTPVQSVDDEKPLDPLSPPEVEPSTIEQSAENMPDPLLMQQANSPAPDTSTLPASSEKQSTVNQSHPNPMDDKANGFTPVTPQKPRRAKWLIPAIVAAALVILGGSGVLAYKFWYQNPEKVISDGLMNALEAKSMTYSASMKVTSNGVTPYTINVTGISKDGANSVNTTIVIAAGGQSYTVKAGGVIDATGNLYLNVSNLKDVAKSYETQLPAQAAPLIDDFIKKIDGQWIKIDNSTLKSFSEDYAKIQQCNQNVTQKIQNDKSYVDEIVTIYKAHPLFKIVKELGSKDGNLGYQIATDDSQRKGFNDDLHNSKIYKAFHDCDSNVSFDVNDPSGDNSQLSTTAEIWVSRWTHEIANIKMVSGKGGDTTELTVQPSFNTSTPVEAPKNTKSAADFMQDIQNLEAALLEASIEAQAAQSNGSVNSDLFTTPV